MTDTERNIKQEQAWETLADMSEKMDAIHTVIYIGNGKPSLMVRLDRLEQKTRLMWGTAVAIIGKVAHNSLGM